MDGPGEARTLWGISRNEAIERMNGPFWLDKEWSARCQKNSENLADTVLAFSEARADDGRIQGFDHPTTNDTFEATNARNVRAPSNGDLIPLNN